MYLPKDDFDKWTREMIGEMKMQFDYDIMRQILYGAEAPKKEEVEVKRIDRQFRQFVVDTYGPEIIFADKHDNAIVGIVARCGQDVHLVYDREKIVVNLKKDGLTEEEAEEWIDFNWNAWCGPGTPGILEKLTR